MNVAKLSLVIIIYSHHALYSLSKKCTYDDQQKIEKDEKEPFECNPNQNTSLIYRWRNITYFGLNSNAYLDENHFPKNFHNRSSVTFKDIKIEHGYPTLTVMNLFLINVSINFTGNSFLKLTRTIKNTTYGILYIDNCHFVDQRQLHDRHQNWKLFYLSLNSFNISISNSIFSKFSGNTVLRFLGTKNNDDSIVFANNHFINNRKISKFLYIRKSKFTFVNNTIKFNDNINSFFNTGFSNILFYNNTVSMNINFTEFLKCRSNKYRAINVSKNSIKFNYVKSFLHITGKNAQIKMKDNHYYQNVFDNVIHGIVIEEQNYVLENEEFSLNNCTIFSLKDKSGKVTISNSKFQFGGFYQTLASCPLIDVKQLKKIKLISSNLTACDANIQKRIQFLCGNQYTVSQAKCFSNKIKCDKNDYSLLKVVFPTGFAALIGWIILNVWTMKVKKQRKKLFDKSTQTQLPEDIESDDSAANYYDTVD